MSGVNAEQNTEAEAQALTPEQEQQRKKLMNEAWSMLYRSARHKQADEVDLSAYTLPWVYSAHTWQCDVPPNRATIRLVRDGSRWWEACSESLAAEKAQQLWDKTAIVRQYNAGKVLRAQYGYSEVETGYAVMLGGCESPDHPNYRLDDRAEYMAGCALSETLIYALDVKGFQAYRGIPTKWIDDEKTLAIMHKRRAESAHIPPEARAESRQWLTVHKANRSC